jgi:hypothetical protein
VTMLRQVRNTGPSPWQGGTFPGTTYEQKHLAKHLPGEGAQRNIRREGEAHVFNDTATFEIVQSAIATRGKQTGTVRGTLRYGVMFDSPIGYRIDSNGTRLPLHYGEAKVNPKTGAYHIMPRTGPSKE